MKPRLLLVEDDAVSCLFMVAALEAMPAWVDAAGSMASALAIEGRHDLLLLDANLPDGLGIDLLAALRSRYPGLPALAHTADDSPALHAQLMAAGFDEVLHKPLSATDLQKTVRRHLGIEASSSMRVEEAGNAFRAPPLWDHATALAALNGNREHVSTLRNMFLDELGRQHLEILSALRSGDNVGVKKILHQLKASSGFVGALRLNAATAALDSALDEKMALDYFTQCVSDTLAQPIDNSDDSGAGETQIKIE
ncbi:MAG: response regulator [Pseudoxanthomonas sp.]